MIDTKHLRTLAEAATPGPWMRLFGERTVYDRMEDGCRGIAIVRSDYSPPTQKEAANIDYIAACSPDVLLALLDALERKDAEIEALQARVAELQRGKDLEVKALAIDGAIVVSLFGMLVVLLHVAGVI